MVRKKTKAGERRSGFARQLRAYFHRATEAWETQRIDAGPRNAQQLSAWMTVRGESLSPRMAIGWYHDENMPSGRYIALLEALLGAPWIYLDDPRSGDVTEDAANEFRARYVSGDSLRRALRVSAAVSPTDRKGRGT